MSQNEDISIKCLCCNVVYCLQILYVGHC